jgi:hypothetical protein
MHSQEIKLVIYLTIIRSVATCGSEDWTPSKSDENTLRMWERRILRKICGPVKENGVWRIRTNQGLVDLHREPNTISEIRKGRLR